MASAGVWYLEPLFLHEQAQPQVSDAVGPVSEGLCAALSFLRASCSAASAWQAWYPFESSSDAAKVRSASSAPHEQRQP